MNWTWGQTGNQKPFVQRTYTIPFPPLAVLKIEYLRHKSIKPNHPMVGILIAVEIKVIYKMACIGSELNLLSKKQSSSFCSVCGLNTKINCVNNVRSQLLTYIRQSLHIYFCIENLPILYVFPKIFKFPM